MATDSFEFKERQQIHVYITSENNSCIDFTGVGEEDYHVLGPYQEGCPHEGYGCYDTWVTPTLILATEYAVCMQAVDDLDLSAYCCSYKWQSFEYIPNPNIHGTEEFDMFGVSVACGDTFFIVGARDEDAEGRTDIGAAYIYRTRYQNLLYTLQPDNVSGSGYGKTVAITEDYAFVSRDGEYGPDDSKGAIYVYDNTSGLKLAKLNNPVYFESQFYNPSFGHAIAASSRFMVVGAPGQPLEGGGSLSTGMIHIFDNVTWNLRFTIPNPVADAINSEGWFGAAVDITNTHCLVGAFYEDSGASDKAGAAYLFDTFTGGLLRTLTNPNTIGTIADDQFGVSVSLTTTEAFVGAWGENGHGVVYVFSLWSGALLHTITTPRTDLQGFGWVLSSTELYTAVGTYNTNYAYVYDNVSRQLIRKIVNVDEYNQDDNFASVLALSNAALLVGAPTAFIEEDTDGAAYLYPICSTPNSVRIDNPSGRLENDGDFAEVVSCSEEYCVAGAQRVSGAVSSYSGEAYIFYTATGELAHTLVNPNDYGAEYQDYFGGSVGNTDKYTVIGASGAENPAGESVGAAYIYLNSTGELLHSLYNPGTVLPTFDDYGGNVAICDQYTAVAAVGAAGIAAGSFGVVWIYSNYTGGLVQRLDAPADGSDEDFGGAIAICTSYTLIGDWDFDVDGIAGVGRAYLYSNMGAVVHVFDNPEIIYPNGNHFGGNEVGVCESYSIIGAPDTDDDSEGWWSSGAAYIFSNDTGELLHKLINPDPGTGYIFGWSVDICETMAIVGAPFSAKGSYDVGECYVYSTATGELLYTLANPTLMDPHTDWFGWTTDISESKAMIGTHGGMKEDLELPHGAAYLFDFADCVLPPNYIVIDNPNLQGGDTEYDYFGWSVDIEDTYMIVASHGEENNSGTVYIYYSATGELVHGIPNPNPWGTASSDTFGAAVAICESYSIVGAPSAENSTLLNYSGVVYIYDNVTGEIVHTIENPTPYGTAQFDSFGFAVGICEEYSIVGARTEDDANSDSAGKAYIYVNSTGGLLHTLDSPVDTAGDTGEFGTAVAICQLYAIVGGPYMDGFAQDEGLAYIYSVSNGERLHTLSILGVSNYQNHFGAAVDICDSFSIVGAPNADNELSNNSGEAFIYDNVTGDLLFHLINPNVPSQSTYDDFGAAVAICETRAIVGSLYRNIDGISNAGAVYIYSTLTGLLLETILDPDDDGEPAGDFFGRAVGITETQILVGAYGEDSPDGSDESGKVYLFTTADEEV